jgi:hypothetical protein
MAAVQIASKSRLMEFLTTPWVDKTIAVIAVTPNSLELYHRYTDDWLDALVDPLVPDDYIMDLSDFKRPRPRSD